MQARLWVALAAGLAVIAGPAAAASIVDQTSLPGDGATINNLNAPQFALPGQPLGFAQSFTVGQTGRLDAIAFGLLNFDTARVMKLSIFSGVPANMDGSLLYRADFLAERYFPTPGAFTSWSSLPTVDLRAANLQVHAGHRLTFALTLTLPQQQMGLVDGINNGAFIYDGGAKYSLINGRFGAFGAGDFAFRTYMTVPDPVPEPQTWTLLIAGFGLAGARLRRRRIRAEIRLSVGVENVDDLDRALS